MTMIATDYVCAQCRGDVVMNDEYGSYECAESCGEFDLDQLEAVTPDPVTGRVREPMSVEEREERDAQMRDECASQGWL